ncbi:MAG: efflux RND transporter permease subunit [Verrucomicrobiota bacterium]
MSDSPEPSLKGGGPIAWMVANPVVANLVMIFLLVGGGFTAWNTQQEVFPEVEIEEIQVSIQYPGASPEEIESGVVQAMESALRGVSLLTEVRGVAREGYGVVTSEFQRGADRMEVYQEVREAVDGIRTLPDDAEEAEIRITGRKRDVLEITIYGPLDPWNLRNLAERVRDRFLQEEEITNVEIEDARDFRVYIEPSREALRTYGLTLQGVADIVSTSSVELPSGGVKTTQGEILVRFDERRDFADEFREIPILTTESGAELRLGDLATVREGFEDTDGIYTYNGQTAINLEVFRIGDQRPKEVVEAALAAMEDLLTTLPEEIEYVVQDDRSVLFDQRLGLLTKNFGLGLLLVLFFLALFLEIRLAFWVTLGIPISFLGAFLLLPVVDVSLNIMSMFAFIIALGIVVDDAIVVGEAVHARRERGLSPQQAAADGAKRMASPVAFAILTNVVAFSPIFFVPGFTGQMWFAIPVVVSAVFLISWVESIFILPSHLAHLKEPAGSPLFRWIGRQQQKVSRLLQGAIDQFYAPFLKLCLRNRYLVLASGLALFLVVVAYFQSGRLGWNFFPQPERDEVIAAVFLPVGSPLSEALVVREQLERSGQAVVAQNGGESLSTGYYSSIEGSQIRTRFYLTPSGERPIGAVEFEDVWRQELGTVRGAEVVRFFSTGFGRGDNSSLNVELSHSEIDTLQEASETLAAELAKLSNVSDIDDGFELGKKQRTYRLTPEGRSLGLTTQDVARQVRASFFGAESLRQMRGSNEVRVHVRLPEEQRTSEYDIEELFVTTPTGQEVPLRQVAEVEEGRAYRTIRRRDGNRTLNLTADVSPERETSRVIEALEQEMLPALKRQFPGLRHSYEGNQASSQETLDALLFYSVTLALPLIYFLLAIPFRSYFQPLVVMFAIPFGLVGAILGHLIMGYSMSVISIKGIIALSGVVINGSLVMVVYANERRRVDGETPAEAVLDAGIRRFRPILLTTLTTFGGLAPMIFETERQAQFLIPIAISLGFGLVFATAITLVIVPALYLTIDDAGRVFRWLVRGKQREAALQKEWREA